MPRPTLFTIPVVFSLILASTAAEAADALARARASLARGDGGAAVTILEDAIPTASKEAKPSLLAELRRAYDQAATRAEADGKTFEAGNYRQNLAILSRVVTTPQPVAEPKPEPEKEPKPASKPAAAPSSLPEPAPVDKPTEEIEPSPGSTPRPAKPTATATAKSPIYDAVVKADSEFRAEHYREAGKLYAGLAKIKELPKDRFDHWAYCRISDVVERINANPATQAEWDQVRDEVRRIRDLNPRNWYAVYLQNLIADRAGTGAGAGPESRARKQAGSRKLVMRGAAPEEQGPAPSPRGPAPAAKSPKVEAVRLPIASAPGSERAATTAGQWQVRLTPNFRILHNDPALADKAARVAETTREAQIKRWVGDKPPTVWSPRCDVYLYTSATAYSRQTGQPEDSPGISTMGQSQGRIVSRKVSLQADRPNMLSSILPHEVTHVVLADLFPNAPVPRWADEGMAIMAETPSEQARRSDLTEQLASGRLFTMKTLMSTDNPEDQHWPLYLAQSASLTRYLVDQGTPAQFVKFLKGAEQNGFEPELRKVYRIEGFKDLQDRWLANAKEAAANGTITASNPDPAKVAR